MHRVRREIDPNVLSPAQSGPPVRKLAHATARRSGRLLPLIALGFLFLLLAPYGTSLLASAASPSAPVTTASSSISGTVLWDSVNTDTAPNAASAISWTFGNVATVQFTWTGAAGGPSVSQAFLVILFLGFPAYTKQEVEATPLPSTGGTISMTYDMTAFRWYLQGLYQVHAYLENPNGTSLWSEYFYVRVAQPYDIVVATVGLLLLMIAELYMIVTVGPRAADKLRKTSTPSSSTPAPSSSGSASGESSEDSSTGSGGTS